MGASLGWHKYVGDEGESLQSIRSGQVHLAKSVMQEFGFTEENVIENVKAILQQLNMYLTNCSIMLLNSAMEQFFS